MSHRIPWSVAGLIILSSWAIGQTRRDVPASYPTIQAAIAAASVGDAVVVAPGVYFENINFLGKSIVVRSAGGAGVTTIDGGQAGPVVVIRNSESSAAVLRGFTITNGLGGPAAAPTGVPPIGEAGGIDIRGSASPRIISCVITGNTGGGGYGAPGSMSTFANIATPGGPGGLHVSGLTTIIDCDVIGNFGGAGGDLLNSPTPGFGAIGGAGGIEIADAAKVYRSRIVGNSGGPGGLSIINGVVATANGGPGGIGLTYTNQASNSPYFYPDLHRCRIAGNFGGTSGGIGGVRSVGAARFDQCEIVGNTSGLPDPSQPNSVTGPGGALLAGPSFTFEFGTIAGNMTVAGNATASVTTAAGLLASPVFFSEIRNSVIWGNVALLGFAPDYAVGSGLSTASLLGCDVGTTNLAFLPPTTISVNPLFANPAAGDYRLSANSPCIDFSVPNPIAVENPPKDIDGNPRWLGAAPDIGASESGTYDASLLGSDDDIALASRIVGQGSPYDTTKSVPVGARFGFAVFSPRRSFWFHRPIFVVDIFPTGLSPVQNPTFPEFHWGPNRFVILDGNLTGDTFGSMPYFDVIIPPTLAGFTARIQVITFEPTSANGFFAATDAHDVMFF